jgi:hypothetical protein
MAVLNRLFVCAEPARPFFAPGNGKMSLEFDMTTAIEPPPRMPAGVTGS